MPTRLLTAFVLFTMGGMHAQDSPEFVKYKKAYPDEHLARLKSDRFIDISLENDEIKISQTIAEEDLLLNETAQFATEGSVDYSSFFVLNKIEAASLIYDGKKYREYKVADFVSKDELSESFYDDMKSVNFMYPKLKQGAIKKLNYTTFITNPRFLSPVYFGNSFPLVKQRVELSVDKNISVRFEKMNMEGVDVRFRESEKRGRNVYIWEIDNQEGYDIESNAPSPKSFLPHIIPIISSYNKKDENVSVLNDVGDLYNWYYSLVKEINQDNLDQELVEITENLIAYKSNDLDKVKAIYYWVQENIKYIDFEYALGGFVPRDANTVFQKKFGDCKDNSSILKEMFKIANLEGNLTWLGTRDIPYSYDEVPTPAADNHMILTYEDNDKTYFLDATGRYLPLEIPSSFIQGKEALIEKGENDYKIVKVPIVPARDNGYRDTVHINLDGNSVKGTGTLTLTGYQKSDAFNYLERRESQDKRREYYNSLLRKGSNRFLIERFEEKNKFSYDEPFVIDYNFTIRDYAQSLEDEIFINLNLYQSSINSYRIKEDRKTDKEFRYKLEDSSTVIFKIPAGKEVTYLPENVIIDNDFMSAFITYQLDGNTITYTHSYTTKMLILTKDMHKSFKESLKKINKAFKEVVVLK